MRSSVESTVVETGAALPLRAVGRGGVAEMLHVIPAARRALAGTGLGAVALAITLGLAGSLAAPSVASAQMREFTGKVDTVNDKKIIIDNRQGDKVSFNRIDETVVEGEK